MKTLLIYFARYAILLRKTRLSGQIVFLTLQPKNVCSRPNSWVYFLQADGHPRKEEVGAFILDGFVQT